MILFNGYNICGNMEIKRPILFIPGVKINMSKNILYIRNFASKVNINTYNLQEIGFGKALVRKGFNCDVVYFNGSTPTVNEEVYEYRGKKLKIIWMKGAKVFSNGIYKELLNRDFLSRYDVIITTEYYQIMTHLLAQRCPEKLILYHGPYNNEGNLFFLKVYDTFVLPKITKRINRCFVKSDLAKEYLINKGFQIVDTLGVGLDEDKLKEEKIENKYISDKLSEIVTKKKLLYIGVLEERRNIYFLLNVFKRLLSIDPEFRLIIVGNGKERDKKMYREFMEYNYLMDKIVYFPKIEQKHLWQIFSSSDIMLFPSKYDIFGMVLLESMYFNVPIISSLNGGSSTIIEHRKTGIIIEQFDEEVWVDEILGLVNNPQVKENIKIEQKKAIERFTWDNIADKLLHLLAN